MNVSRGIVITAMLTGLAVGAAATASAAPTMSGHYIMTATAQSGETTTSDWYFTPCGDGCASVASTSGGQAFGQARLRDGWWTLVWHSDAICLSGSTVPGALSSYDTWDANTLAGTDESGPASTAVCGFGARPRVTQNLQLTQAG
jgi:hypothetical protein